MLIEDLSYLESISEPNAISGGVFVGVGADASAGGNSTVTLTDTTTKTHELGNGGSIGIGRGKAIAIGSDPLAVVIVDGSGDKVIAHTKEHYFAKKNMMVARGSIVVIDRP